MFGMPTPLAATIVGFVAALLACGMTRWGFRSIQHPVKLWDKVASVGAGLLGALLCLALLNGQAQLIHEVRPTPFWFEFRVVYHVILVALLVAATCTDLADYFIPDCITFPGMLIGLGLAVLSGDLQTTHVWVDWNQAIPQIQGPYLPEWLSSHPHLHGLAWSTAGLLTGMALTSGVRFIASRVMGMEALGLGDVTLMGMVGSFLGWQPTVIAFLLAPLCAITIGLVARLLGGKSYIPYGPYLAAGSLIVMFAWRWIWTFELKLYEGAEANDRAGVFSVRRLFGDWPSLVALLGILVVSLVLLLGLSRLYRKIPGRRDASKEDAVA